MISLPYIAGFFDGEGCVSIGISGKNKQVRLKITLVNTEVMILEMLHAMYGGYVSKGRVAKKGWKPFRSLQLTGKKAFRFISDIRPYVIVKRAQVELAIEFWEFQHLPKLERCDLIKSGALPGGGVRVQMIRKHSTIQKEQEFKSRMHVLNRKGLVA